MSPPDNILLQNNSLQGMSQYSENGTPDMEDMREAIQGKTGRVGYACHAEEIVRGSMKFNLSLGLSEDGYILFSTRILRSFAYGFLSVILALYLSQLGLSEVNIGLLLTLTLLGDTVISLFEDYDALNAWCRLEVARSM